MPIKTMQEMFTHELGDIYDAEQQFLAGQEELLGQATEPALRQGLQTHIKETRDQIGNLEQAFRALGEAPKRQPCAGAKGLVGEAHRTLKEAANPALRDCLIGGAAEKVEHYEIPSYQGLLLVARALKQPAVVALLDANLKQEQATAKELQAGAKQRLAAALQADGPQG